MREIIITYKIMIENFEGLGRPRRKWEKNIEMDLKKQGWSVCAGFIWQRIGIGGGMWSTRVTTRPAFRGTVPKTYVKFRVPHFA
jgi:hypothetical protein